MNNDYQQEIRYRLLKILNRNPNFTQREMAREMGISLGKVNFCLAELAKKGFIRINRFKDSENKLQYLYKLTPSGLEAKAGLTVSFLKRKISEYNEIKNQIRELAREANVAEPLDLAQDEMPDEAGRVF
ncbi:MAG: MarR family EPS-associated transcriptional regulator [Desulfobacterales bacterium]|nr:MarR family EPS-associated transcriptional regulator [Desulfobacterales bacterium]